MVGRIKAGIVVLAMLCLIFVTGCQSYDVQFKGEHLIIDGVVYDTTEGYFNTEKAPFCRVDGFKLYKLEDDDRMDFIYAHSFTDGSLYVRNDYIQTYDTIIAIILYNREVIYKDEDTLKFFDRQVNMREEEISFDKYKDEYLYTFMIQYDNQAVCNRSYKVFIDSEECIFFDDKRIGHIVDGEDKEYFKSLCDY